MSDTKSVSVGSLKKGDTIIIDGAPCKIVDTSTSRPGKHGHAKVNMMAVGMLDGKKSIAFNIFYDAIDIVSEKTSEDGLEIWEISSWHIGGNDKRVVEWVVDYVHNSWPIFDDIRQAAQF